MKTNFGILFLLAITLSCTQKSTEYKSNKIQGEEIAILTDAPEVPPVITRTHSTKVIVNLETKELVGTLADGVQYTYWTFGGKVPGKFIRVREGDLVEFNLQNHPSSKMPHNIDLHAVTGPGGGAAASFTAPGHSSKFSFKALKAGLYVYHCATAPVGMHIANGMYGLILVQPKEGFPKVDHEYYIFQSEFYTKGIYGAAGLQTFSMKKALTEIPDYVVFNGSVGSTTGDKSLPAKVGETVRLYVGNGGPNLVSSFHVIGEIFDTVYPEGGLGKKNKNVQTTIIPAGGSAIVEFKLDTTGTLIIVDHSIFRAFNKGALAMIKVDGIENKSVYSGKTSDTVYHPEGGSIQDIINEDTQPLNAKNIEQRISFGKRIYKQNCAACHQENGQGIAHAFPPLAKSDYLNATKARAIKVLINGLKGKVTVNGAEYDGIMPSQNLNNEQVANVLTYIYSVWGNSKKIVTPKEVNSVRNGH